MIALIAALALCASDDPFDGMQNPKRLLQSARFTPAQVHELRAIRRASASRESELNAQLERLGTQLEEALTADRVVDEDEVTRLFEQWQQATAELERLKLHAFVQMRTVLTPEQRSRVAATHRMLRELPPTIER